MKFPDYLTQLRENANLTNQQLAVKANVPRSLIAGLQSGKRRVGEYNARKIGDALGLTGAELEDFIYSALDTCTVKVINDHRYYPAELLNLLAKQLRGMGILPEQVEQYRIDGDNKSGNVDLFLKNGDHARIATMVAYN